MSDAAPASLAAAAAPGVSPIASRADHVHPLPSAEQVGASSKAAVVLGWIYGQSYQLASGTRNGDGALTSGSVVWPDGVTGTYTATSLSAAFPGAVDAYTITRVVGLTTTTYTQPAVTRDAATGAVTAQPAIIIS